MGTIADKLGLLQGTKAAIRAAIEEKGQTVPEDTPFSGYPGLIRDISGGAKIDNARDVEVVAADRIRIGDTVYTVEKDAMDWGASRRARTAAFSPDGKMLVLGGEFAGYAKAYSVSGTTITYISDIYADSGTTALSSTVASVVFSPDGKLLLLGGDFTGYAKAYSVSGTAITYISNIYADSGTTALSGSVNVVAFSPDGKMLVMGGIFARCAKAYSVSGTAITYISDIYANSGTTALSYVYAAAFSPDGKMLVLGGSFTGRAKAYLVDGTAITYISDIRANSGTNVLSGNVYVAAFSLDGKMLLLGGDFTGKAKVYSVSGTAITYISDIYANSGTTALNSSVYAAAFSPDGKMLVLGGSFTGCAKVYSVDGTAITYISNIYANSGTVALISDVRTVTFFLGGKMLVLVGSFTGYAKVYECTEDRLPIHPTGTYMEAHVAPEGNVSQYTSGCGIGFAKEDLECGGAGQVTVIATLK